MLNKVSCFAPIVSLDSKILILGSIPGAKSIEYQQYYAHPQNNFWKIMFEIFGENFTNDYSEKIALLLNHQIALWDVIDSCIRKGSLDSEIRNEQANDIALFLQQYPNIKVLFCNGQKSYKNLIKTLGNDFPLQIIILPSTSPANAMMKFQEKLLHWSIILKFLV